MTTEEKKIALEKIAQEIKAFKGLEIARNAINGVAGEGNPDSEILFIGEAPGRNEDESGRPFVGQAGKLLEKNLNVIGLQRSDVFITNIVKYRPPDNRDPFPEEILVYRGCLIILR
jgi:DNA polymerase